MGANSVFQIHSKLMQTCTIFATYTNWLSRELEKADPDLSGAVRPPNMTEKQWGAFLAVKTQRPPGHGDSASSASSQASDH